MIPRDYITEWREHAPWSEDFQVEQDLIISRALVEMFSDSVLSEGLAFRGGTALYKLYLTPPARYSEDIDLIQVRPGPFGPLMDGLRNVLDPWLGDERLGQAGVRMADRGSCANGSRPIDLAPSGRALEKGDAHPLTPVGIT